MYVPKRSEHGRNQVGWNPYERFANEQLILRDQLAIDRTVLANERTLLAFVRTGLALAVTGGGLLQFFHSFVLGAWGLVVVGAATILAGVIRYRTMRGKIRKVEAPLMQAGKNGAGFRSVPPS